MCRRDPQPHTQSLGKEGMDVFGDVLSLVYTDSALKHAIEVLDLDLSHAEVPNQPCLTNRNARSRAERQLLDGAAQVLTQMRPLATNVQNIGRVARKQTRVYSEMANTAKKAQNSVAVYAEEAQFLASQQSEQETQRATLESYMKHIYLNSTEKQLLQDPNFDVSPEFFAAFMRARDIYAHTAPIMLAEAPRAGELLMLEITQLLDDAYAKIVRAIERELKRKAASSDGTLENEPEATEKSSLVLSEYMALLTDRPLLFKAVLERQSGARKTRIVREFAIFCSKEHGSAAYFPVRYIGSLLAWTHAAVVNEIEHISLLLDGSSNTLYAKLGNGDHKGMESCPNSATLKSNDILASLLSTSNPHKIITELVDQVINSVEPNLRQQLNALVMAQSDPALVDELQSVLLFYQHTVLAKYEQPKLNLLFDQISEHLTQQFERTLPATWVSRVALALQVAKTHEHGVFSNHDFVIGRLNAVIDPALQSALKDVDIDHEGAIPALNILDTAVTQLAGFITAQPKLDELKKLEAEFVAKQVAREVTIMQEASKLTEFQAQAISLREFQIALDEFLSTGGGQDLVFRLDTLSSPTTAHEIASSVIDEFVSQYEFATRDVTARSAEEVRALLL